MFGAVAIALGSVVTAVLCLYAAALWRKEEYVPISWHAFIGMALGAIAISAFYLGIALLNYRGLGIETMIPWSRALWWVILITTSLMAITAIYEMKCCREK